MPRWNLEALPANRWLTANQAAQCLSITPKQLLSRVAPASRKPPAGIETRRITIPGTNRLQVQVRRKKTMTNLSTEQFLAVAPVPEKEWHIIPRTGELKP